MNTRMIVISLVLSLIALAPLAGEDNNPAWVAYEKGMLELGRKEYGKALAFFKEAISIARTIPEAEIGIGDVYFYLGDYPVAERQYQKAYEERKAFFVPDMQYAALYRLARLYSFDKRYGEMEATLKLIVKDDEVFNAPRFALLRQKLVELFEKKGFDQMFKLNRIEENFASSAHAELGFYYYITWNFVPAFDQALFGVIPVLTESMLEIRRKLPDYQYSTLIDFLRTGLGIETVRDYLAEKNFFKRLYYLALICYEKIPIRDSGIELLEILAASDAAGEYQRLARLQLKTPWREKRLDSSRIEMP